MQQQHPQHTPLHSVKKLDKNVVDIHFLVAYFTIKDVQTSNSHILVVPKGSHVTFLPKIDLGQISNFYKTPISPNPWILRNLGFQLVPFVRTEDNI